MTLISGEGKLKRGVGPVRTGVTAILPNEGNIFYERLHAGGFVLNGAGEVSGLTQVLEWGLLETPIALTNTLSVGHVSAGVIDHMLEEHPSIGREHDVIIPLVGECDDSWLNDIGGNHVAPRHAVQAIRAAKGGPVEEGERVLRPLRAFGSPMVDVIVPKPFVMHQAMLDAVQPPGRNYYWKSDDLLELTDDAIDTIVAHSEAITSPHTIVPIFQFGGVASRVAEDATAYSYRKAYGALNCNASWTEGEPEQHIEWARDFSSAMQPYSAGVYVNFLSNESEDRIKAAYGAAKYERLVKLKNKYDPTNLFRINQNIRPTA